MAWLARHRVAAVLAAFLALVFLLGGASRADVLSLPVLRPLSVLVLAWALAGLRREDMARHRLLLGLAAAWLALHLLQLVPLPPQVWQALPGRDIVAEIDRTAGLGEVWRPLTLVPAATRNALWSLAAPLAVLVLGVRLSAEERALLLPLAIGLALASALVGALQLLGDPQGPLYFYAVTNHGSAVGLFANRNHQAVLLATLPPMLLVWAALRGRGTGWAIAAGGVLLITPLILVTGSRSGLLAGLIGLASAPLLLAGRTRRLRGAASAATLLALGVAALALATVLLGRGTAFERLLGSGAEDLRFQVLGTILEMIRLYSPWGTGLGSFAEVYQIHEPHRLLAPAYLNHAHNDLLELILTGGWPALALLLAAAAAFAARLSRLLRRSEHGAPLARLGLLILAILAAASLGDYPLRTPSLACLAALAALWAAPSQTRPTGGDPGE